MFPTTSTPVIEDLRKLDDMIAQSTLFDMSKHDHHGEYKGFSFDENARLLVPNVGLFAKLSAGTPPLALTRNSLSQICSLLGKVVYGKSSGGTVPSKYIEAIPADLRATILNRHLSDYKDDGRLLARCYEDNVRAFVSDRYAKIDNTEVLTMLRQVLEDKAQNAPVRFVRSFVNPDETHVKMTIKETRIRDDDSGNYGVGVYVGNDEIGGTSLKVRPLIQRHACTNSIIPNVEIASFDVRHVGNAAAIMMQFASALVQALSMGEKVLNRFAEAKYIELPNFTDVLSGLAEAHSWSDEMKFAVAAGTENSATVQGIVNGISFAAHSVRELSDTARIDLEQLAGDYLFAPISRFNALAR